MAHPVQVKEESRLARLLGAPMVSVNSRQFSRQRCRAWIERGGPHARRCDRGAGVPAHPFALTVQWHPENLQHRPERRALFEKFVEAAQKDL